MKAAEGFVLQGRTMTAIPGKTALELLDSNSHGAQAPGPAVRKGSAGKSALRRETGTRLDASNPMKGPRPASESVADLFIGTTATPPSRRPPDGSAAGATGRPHTASSARVPRREQDQEEGQGMSAWQRLTRPGTALVSGETDEGSRAVSTHVGQDVDFSAQQRTRCRQESELGQRRSNDGEVKDDILPLEGTGRLLTEDTVVHCGSDNVSRGSGTNVHGLSGQRALHSRPFSGSISVTSSHSSALSWRDRLLSAGEAGLYGASLARSSQRASVSLWDDQDLSAPGLDDARALLRSWIDSEQTYKGNSPPREEGGHQRESLRDLRRRKSCAGTGNDEERNTCARDSLDEGFAASEEEGEGDLPKWQEHDACEWARFVNGGRKGSYKALREETSEEGSQQPQPGMHSGRVEASIDKGDTSDDDKSAPQSRWQAMFSREAVRQSVTHELICTDLLNEPVARPTEAWRRRADESSAAPTRVSRDVSRTGGVWRPGDLSSAVLPMGARARSVKPRDVLSTLEARHQQRVEQRQKRRSMRDASPSMKSRTRSSSEEGEGMGGGSLGSGRVTAEEEAALLR